MIGAGNVATHLALALKKAGHDIISVFSATEDSAKFLAEQVASEWTNDLKSIPGKADFYIVSVRDNALEGVVSEIQIMHGMIMHTTGSVGLDIFEGRFEDYGVFYPFQTFRKEQLMDMGSVPLLIESNSAEGLVRIRDLAESIASRVIDFSSEQRQNLHLTAAFACNFTNYMVSVAEALLEEHHIDRALILPLMEETFRKIMLGPAREMQTGPAVRGDTVTMKKHLNLLEKHPEWQKLYNFMSELIQKNDKL